MKIPLKKLHARFYRYSVAAFFIIFWPFLYFFSRKPQRYPAMNFFRKVCGFCSSTIAGIFYKFEYEQPIDWSRPYIICPNHTSNLDITAMSLMVKNNFCFIGKQELLKNMVTKLFFQTIDIPVNRESKMSSFRAFKSAAERLQQGMSMVIFPEGKIPDDFPPKLHEFKNGPFRLAIEHQIPIIPVTSLNTWDVLWDTGLERGSRPGICHIKVHKPIETANLTVEDADRLRDEVYSLINHTFESYANR
ncbi:1-acyl-sn-glycerol-3-phosphate acyltransferase [Mucilaginibacter daejeonensis]|uniref:lysophospholipid acyltransferase family protein n=1 Tax=Mucilaginibacter daejeonensis TaxID=398049 RepID=UPI001D175A72|nr:lysophospholipid acyltransferase family protein [Mucilaginibacter daejeonensis]UEG51611.1 1-acyl-sn-glycerol-3-phosphate acyltransferase [Mucilaginibacter daejeonensis]